MTSAPASDPTKMGDDDMTMPGSAPAAPVPAADPGMTPAPSTMPDEPAAPAAPGAMPDKPEMPEEDKPSV
ncbi:MAG TPA: hypothetical protein VJC17_04040 [Candidatus Dojkabacteria bacterium]|nr:hypothetical protein [Candidatus Dojkabacteria bacterium]